MRPVLSDGGGGLAWQTASQRRPGNIIGKLTRSEAHAMKALAAVGVLASVIVAGCSALPTAGPTASDVKGQEVKNNLTRFDLVNIDDNVVATLLALPAESFHVRFKKYGRPPRSEER